MNITIKQINAEDTWDIRHRVMWPKETINYVKLPKDDLGIHFGLFKDHKLVAIISLFIEKNIAQFRKLATEIEEQNNGFASILIQHILEYSKKKQLEKIWCNARVSKCMFYEKFGMQKTNNTYIKKGVEFIVMEKKINYDL